MVIVKLYGGLGNQLFQYALGRKIAAKNSVALKLDVLTGFENDFYRRKYSLGHFNIQENFASLKEITALTKRPIVERVLSRTLRRPPKTASTYIREKLSFHFDPDILSLPNGVYLDGYWQSEKYFLYIQEIIRKEFTVKTSLTGMNLKIAREIIKTNSICVHVRRLHGLSGGNVNERAVKKLGAVSLDYYYNAIKYLSDKYSGSHFFIFGDDLEWVRENLKLPYSMTVVDHNGPDKAYEDLRLMSQCKHHIIANSSFSWWGAWLAQRRDKIVFAPKSWHACEKFDTSDLIPDKWTRI